VPAYPAFVDETGILTGPTRQQPVYGIGLLVVKNSPIVTDSLYRLHFNFRSARATERGKLIRAIRSEERSPTLDELHLLLRDTRHHEYKFSEVTSRNLQQYIDLLNVFFSVGDFEFHALLIDRLDDAFSLGR